MGNFAALRKNVLNCIVVSNHFFRLNLTFCFALSLSPCEIIQTDYIEVVTSSLSTVSVIQSVVANDTARTVNENFTRQASQISALLNTTPTSKPESARAVNPTAVPNAYYHRGEIEKEEEPTG